MNLVTRPTDVLVVSTALFAVLGLAVCGGGAAPSSPSASGGTTITISAGGVVSPHHLTVPPGTQVTFTNNDSKTHEMYSDPHPDHTDCPEFNQVGFLSPGQSRQTGNLNIVRSCGFHDHSDPTNTGLQGTIVIQ